MINVNEVVSVPPGGVLLGTATTSLVTILKSDYPNGKFGFLGETTRSIPNPSSLQNVIFYVERTEGLLGMQEVNYVPFPFSLFNYSHLLNQVCF